MEIIDFPTAREFLLKFFSLGQILFSLVMPVDHIEFPPNVVIILYFFLFHEYSQACQVTKLFVLNLFSTDKNGVACVCHVQNICLRRSTTQ